MSTATLLFTPTRSASPTNTQRVYSPLASFRGEGSGVRVHENQASSPRQPPHPHPFSPAREKGASVFRGRPTGNRLVWSNRVLETVAANLQPPVE